MRPSARRALALGLAVAGAYAVVYVAALRLSGEHQRPLFDGFAPSAPYRWVDPPPAFEDGNVKPGSATIDLPFDAGVFRTASVTSEDGQFVANFPEGSVPVRDGEVSVKATIDPVASGTLGPLPPGLFADGNAYRMTLAYQPSGQALETLAVPGNVVLTVPAPGTVVVNSVDGASWERLEGGGHASGSLAAPFSRAGIFLGAAETPLDFGAGGSGDGGGVWFVVVLILALAAGLVVIPILVRSSRRNRAAARSLERRRAAAQKRPVRKSPPPRPAAQKRKKKKKKR